MVAGAAMGRFTRVLAFVLIALAPTGAFAGPAEDASVLIDRWAVAFNDNNVDALVRLYAPEAILLSSVDPSIHEGTAGVREYYAPVQGSGRKVEIGERHMTVLSDAVVVCTGLWKFIGTRDGKPFVNSARFRMVFTKRGNDWTIVNHHSSSRPEPR